MLVSFGSQLDRLKIIAILLSLLILRIDWAQLGSSSAPCATGYAAVVLGLYQLQHPDGSLSWLVPWW